MWTGLGERKNSKRSYELGVCYVGYPEPNEVHFGCILATAPKISSTSFKSQACIIAKAIIVGQRLGIISSLRSIFFLSTRQYKWEDEPTSIHLSDLRPDCQATTRFRHVKILSWKKMETTRVHGPGKSTILRTWKEKIGLESYFLTVTIRPTLPLAL